MSDAQISLSPRNIGLAGGGPRTADLDVAFALVIVEIFVPVIDGAAEQSGLAITAPAFFAGIHNLDIIVPENFHNGLADGHGEGFAGDLQLDLEFMVAAGLGRRAGLAGGFCAGEQFKMDAAIGPMAGGFAGRVQ
mgnify:CR=1 FL=1